MARSKPSQASISVATLVAQVDLFVFDAAPEPFDEDVVQRSAAPIHTMAIS
jgi:hypothetical protein